MILKIKQVHKSRGYVRYRVGFSSGIPFEFLIHEQPKGVGKREWNALFARSVSAALLSWCKTNYPEGENWWDS